MSFTEEANSTEKLLEVIRGKSNSDTDRFISDSPKLSLPRSASFTPSSWKGAFSKSRLTVGVDVGRSQIRLVKVKVASRLASKHEVLDYRLAQIPADMKEGTPDFTLFLRKELTAFCGKDRNPEIWGMVPSRHVTVRQIRVPKVAASQLGNTVFWTLRKEAKLDLSESNLDFEEQGEVLDQGVPKLSVMTYIVPRDEIRKVDALFSGIGFPLAGISIPCFVIQNILRSGLVGGNAGVLAFLYVGNDYSRIDIYKDGSLMLTRDIKAGITSMLELLLEEDRSREYNAPQEDQSFRSFESARKAFIGSRISEADFEKISPAIERLVRQVERTFEYYSLNFGNAKIDQIYLSGLMSDYSLLGKYVSEQFHIESKTFDLENLRILGKPLASTVSDRMALTSALGLALSTTSVPNLKVTRKDKEKKASTRRANMLIFKFFMVAVLANSLVFGYLRHATVQKNNIVAALKGELQKSEPIVDKDSILRLVSEFGVKQTVSIQYGRRYLGMAVIKEVSDKTPSAVRLTMLKYGTPKKGGESRGYEGQKTLVIEGIIIGGGTSADLVLLDYVSGLSHSPLFSGLEVLRGVHYTAEKDTAAETSINKPGKEAIGLTFTIKMKVV